MHVCMCVCVSVVISSRSGSLGYEVAGTLDVPPVWIVCLRTAHIDMPRPPPPPQPVANPWTFPANSARRLMLQYASATVWIRLRVKYVCTSTSARGA